MATTPSTPRHYDALTPGRTPSREKMRLNGLWRDGEWWCNCEPRQRAVERRVQKSTPNKGRPFWGCPIPSPNSVGCGFFLFFKDARAREVGLQPAVSDETTIAATQTPSRSSKTTPSMTQSRLTAYGIQVTGSRRQSDPEVPASSTAEYVSSSGTEAVPTPTQKNEPSWSSDAANVGTAAAVQSNYTPLTPAPTASSKRKRDTFADDDYFSDVGSDEERQLADMTDRSVEKITRHKSFDYPHISRTVDEVISTPSQPVARTLFPRSEPSNKRQKAVSFEEPRPVSTLTATSAIPSSTSPSSSPEASSDDITEQVMGLLRGQRIEASVLQSVRQLLVTSSHRTQGLFMGRDSARAALNEKNVRIARLQEHITVLENKERLLNSQITNMKASLMKIYEDN